MDDRIGILSRSKIFYRAYIPIYAFVDDDLVGQDLLFGSRQICAVYRYRYRQNVVHERTVVIAVLRSVVAGFHRIQLRIDDYYRKADIAFVDTQLSFDVAVNGACDVGTQLSYRGFGKLQRDSGYFVAVLVFEPVIQLIGQLLRHRNAL